MPKKRLKTSAIKRLRIRLAYLTSEDTMQQLAEEFRVDQGTVSRHTTGSGLYRKGSKIEHGELLWNLWCKEAPKTWQLDREDLNCLMAGCQHRRLQLRQLRAAGAAGASNLDPTQPAAISVKVILEEANRN